MPPITDLPSPNQDQRSGPVDMLLLHYTGMQSAQAAIDRLRDPAAKVSSHYVVDEDGGITRLVAEQNRAWHAGVSFWRGRHQCNDGSIGIEIVNPGHEWGYRPFPVAQIAAVIALCQEILARHSISPWDVVAHSDVAPTRKQDPGELFPWSKLAHAGIGLWPGGKAGRYAPSDWQPTRLWAALGAIGYNTEDQSQAALTAALTAFQRHWRPEAVTGTPDTGTTLRLTRLLAMVPPYQGRG
jgi:N-acetylmuramoyl-L-alanine amidase